MLCRKFKLISIKIGFFLQIFQVAPKLGQSPCTIVQGLEPNFIKNGSERIPNFYIFSDTYTCPYVV